MSEGVRVRVAATVAAAVLAAAAGAQALAAPRPYTVSSVRAYLFFNDTGGFSRSVPQNAPLWNTVIGEGWAGRSSDATLVRVLVTGTAGSYAPDRRVRLTVQTGSRSRKGAFVWGKTILRREQQLAVLTSRGRTTVGFWLAGTGCRPLRVTAVLIGQAPSRATRVIPFACGE